MRNHDGRREAESQDLVEGVSPLSDAERKWIRRLENVLKAQPSRLMMIEIGDVIEIVDRDAASKVDLSDGNAATNGVWLSSVRHGIGKLTGVSG